METDKTFHSLADIKVRIHSNGSMGWTGISVKSQTLEPPSTSLFKIKPFAIRQSGKMETSPRLPPARPSPDRRLIAGVKLIKARVHDATEIGIALSPTCFPTSPFSTINNIAVTDHNDNSSEYAFNYGSSHPATLGVRRSHDVEVKEVCNR